MRLQFGSAQVIDHDTKYAKEFDSIFTADDVEIVRVGPRAPNLNAYSERFPQTLRTECLDHFVVVGEKHLRHIVSEFLTHYNSERPHQRVGNIPLSDEPRILKFPSGRIRCRKRLGGLLKHYHRSAA